ncbi:MAG: sigma-70 family RNA polymerase sigma factor [Bacteroidetes bacterium]|nr:sigma-70 family RNA polymerase sigma factor [Bacteroidota bacterium]
MLLLGVAMKYMKNRTDAEDAVQQVFLKAIMHLPKGEIQNFKGWLYVLMRNHCLQLLRDKSYKAGEEALVHVSASESDKEALLLQEQTLEQLQETLQELNDEQRICVTMFYLQKRSYNEIMAATGFTFAQVKSYIQNGKRNLKILLLKKTGQTNG